MIIDCHGHYMTAPAPHQQFRDAQLARLAVLAAGTEAGRAKVFEGNARRVYPRLTVPA
ncbi:MAG: hypothetical protein ACLPKE_05915 [Streptosporangiaceae bacterium]